MGANSNRRWSGLVRAFWTRISELDLTVAPHPVLSSMPGYQTKQERIAIAGADDLIIRSLLDRRQYFDPLGEADRLGISSAEWPLFGLLWPSGVQLAARMALRPIRRHERILEIGCGLALASLVTHRLGGDVTASDCHPLAETFLNQNLHLNRLEPLKYWHAHWGERELPLSQARCTIQAQYDLVIGSDLLYEADATPCLAAFIARHSAPLGEVWIIDPDRGNRTAFNRQMGVHGFLMREERFDAAASAGVAACKGRLLVYRRAAAVFAFEAPGTAFMGWRAAGNSNDPVALERAAEVRLRRSA